MASQAYENVRRSKFVLPDVEILPVQEDLIASKKRAAEIHQLLARLHVLSHKRGRPSSKHKDEENYAA
jgi:hypothetical protein